MIGDLSEGSCDGLESDDESGEPRSTRTILKSTGNPKVMATKKGPTADKGHWPQSESSRVGSEFMDDNQMKSEFDDVIVATFELVYCRLPMYS